MSGEVDQNPTLYVGIDADRPKILRILKNNHLWNTSGLDGVKHGVRQGRRAESGFYGRMAHAQPDIRDLCGMARANFLERRTSAPRHNDSGVTDSRVAFVTPT